MPELPEVETVMRGLAPVMQGAVIARADVNRPDLRWPFPDRMAERLTGQKVAQLRRRSKYILADLGSGESLLIHLGMSGRMLISGDPLGNFVHDHPSPEKHDHVVFHMANGARITFNDPRRFGAMDLLDQRIVAGLGNIYVCEALYRAGIHPARKAGRISAARVATLVPIIRQVLAEAIEAGGSSLRDFRQADGELGYFQHSFDVYGREGEPCRTATCGAPIKRIVQSGRSSFFCGACQR